MHSEVGRLEGVVIGVLLGFGDAGEPLVVFPGNRREEAVEARSTAALSAADVGGEVALLFEGGDPARPLVIGRLLRPAEAPPAPRGRPARRQAVEVVRDRGDRLELRAEQEIVLRCGTASITLTRAGKVLIRGAYISSWSSGTNRIRGASVHLN
ncbi:DUF6484 domain-containing protein [Falsiroseomonas sp.]|uniref:DUF6484 domain-containing protein n=1 Tax=Falsiroseomonas sp. TaxID=2870721 RepID=UPI0035672EA8